ncbi:metal ABC transporter permease [Marinigracilibium pacificum]|uniref:Metal ABC transporter permease n=1 Tax=Marinigracilibium pacificum TaxID=2729599 RepID=A0A848IZR3_9BACT|nr:metal ABC transporter permease [Marinigracilibium pacificum]NMM50033.1 metal ABC transporter permease [Marinigracilibium pacificum]
MDALIIILAGFLVAFNCGMLGSFLVLRKMAMIGDAISHAVLPGIVLAFMISGSRENLFMMIGAGIIGVLVTVMIEFLSRKGKLPVDAAIGYSFTFLFAIGIILLTAFADDVDIDEQCVLYGEIIYIPFNVWVTSGGITMGPTALWLIGLNTLLIVVVTFSFYKELLITSFNPEFAQSIGIKPVVWHYVLMGLVSYTAVSSFESVGAVLVVGLLIIPPATAYLISNKMSKMLFITTILALITSVAGYYLAYLFNVSVAGAMITVCGTMFLIVFCFTKAMNKKVIVPVTE